MRRRPVSRILSPRDRNPGFDGHSSRRRIAAPLKLPTRPLSAEANLAAVSRLPGTCPRGGPIWHCSRWGLPCRRCCQQRGGLLPHRFTLTRADAPLADLRSGGRSVFCGAFRRVSPPGRYPAPLLHGVRTFLEGGLRAPRGRPAFCATGGVETSACGVKRIVQIQGLCPSWPHSQFTQGYFQPDEDRILYSSGRKYPGVRGRASHIIRVQARQPPEGRNPLASAGRAPRGGTAGGRRPEAPHPPLAP